MTRRADPFFNWFDTAKGLLEVVGIENFRITVFEEGLDRVVGEIADFVDDSWSPRPVLARHNVREGPTGWSATTDGRSRLRARMREAWPTASFPLIRKLVVVVVGPILRLVGGTDRPTRSPITMGEDLREEIIHTYQASNRRIADLCGRDLFHMGY